MHKITVIALKAVWLEAEFAIEIAGPTLSADA
jgi:hypothetical protein